MFGGGRLENGLQLSAGLETPFSGNGLDNVGQEMEDATLLRHPDKAVLDSGSKPGMSV